MFQAENESTKQLVALKLLKIFDMNDVKQRDNCIKEVKLMEKLNHPNITKYIESFIHENEMFIAVEWAANGDLKQHIKDIRSRNEVIPERQIWKYIHQIASALQHMLQMRVMHRDLKPANIFMDQRFNLKLGDLGLGRDFSSQTMEAFSRVGTPLYMSPEVLQGSGYDFQCDVWSLGCIGYEFCALRNPFKDETKKMSLYDLFQKIIKADYLPLSSSRYSAELLYIIDQMLVVNPEERVTVNDVVSYCQNQIELMDQKYRDLPAHMRTKSQNESILWSIENTIDASGSNTRKFAIDPALIMDDIIEKLHLLEYSRRFCATRGLKPLSRFYFAVHEEASEPTEVKVAYFVELCYWLMSLGFQDSVR